MIVTEPRQELYDWAVQGIFGFKGLPDEQCKAIGQVKNEVLISVVTYNNFQCRPDGSFFTCEMGIYTIDKRWASKAYLKAIFTYPFIQLGLERAQIITSAHNEGINSVVSRLGFKKEGEHRKGYPNGDTAYSWGMLREDCRWL